jgi:hypothetical protein
VGGISPIRRCPVPESVSTDNVTVAYVLAAAELTKLVAGAGERSSAAKIAANYKAIYKAVTGAARGDD